LKSEEVVSETLSQMREVCPSLDVNEFVGRTDYEAIYFFDDLSNLRRARQFNLMSYSVNGSECRD
jgi:hypothetical protein